MNKIFFALLLVVFSPSISIAEDLPGFADPTIGTEFVLVKGGCYQMGDGSDKDNPAHKVCVKDFYIAKHVVTQGQWKAITGTYPPYLSNCGDNCPAQQLSWDDVLVFIGKLNQRSGKKYRLPTEAEWEYAAKGGSQNEKWAGTSNESELGNYAWHIGNSEGRVHPIAQKKANHLNLYDMSGNVWQWVYDWYDPDYYRNSPKDNPSGPSSGTSHVLRGGAWNKNSMFTTNSVRNRIVPGACSLDYYGFRLAVTP